MYILKTVLFSVFEELSWERGISIEPGVSKSEGRVRRIRIFSANFRQTYHEKGISFDRYLLSTCFLLKVGDKHNYCLLGQKKKKSSGNAKYINLKLFWMTLYVLMGSSLHRLFCEHTENWFIHNCWGSWSVKPSRRAKYYWLSREKIDAVKKCGNIVRYNKLGLLATNWGMSYWDKK